MTAHLAYRPRPRWAVVSFLCALSPRWEQEAYLVELVELAVDRRIS